LIIKERVEFVRVDIVAFALTATMKIKGDEPTHGKQSQEWIAAMNEELSSLC